MCARSRRGPASSRRSRAAVTSLPPTAGHGGDGGPATAARFWWVQGLAVDGAGNLFMADSANDRVRKVTAATGVVTTVAGNGIDGSSGDGGPATLARLGYASGAALDGAGNLYFADSNNSRIRKVSAATGIITTVAGDGTVGFSGDGGPATAARLYQASNVTVDLAGNLYIVDYVNQRIRMVTAATGIITTIAGNGAGDFTGDGGPATQASLNTPNSVAVDGAGNVYIMDAGNYRVRKIDAATGIITTVAGTGVYEQRRAWAMVRRPSWQDWAWCRPSRWTPQGACILRARTATASARSRRWVRRPSG
ncbi:MAG: hypothetical protein MZV64_42920 [Ignavibacteriales bacterium]|nr:hypothetical protein [Ignavibacteriales bacterium]